MRLLAQGLPNTQCMHDRVGSKTPRVGLRNAVARADEFFAYPDAHPTEQYPPSAQVTTGLKAWSEGRIPTTLVQRWCIQSVIDPLDHPEVAELAFFV